MKIQVHLYSQAEPCSFTNVRNAYTKDGLYCVMCSNGDVYKFPTMHIFRVKELGGPSFIPPREVEDQKEKL